MYRRPLTLRRAFWMFAACVLLFPRFASAVEPTVTADLDGDGRRDRVVVDRGQPSGFVVWLSTSGATEVIRTRMPLLHVIAADIDGDHRPELVALDSNLRMHVWTRKGNQFRSVRRRSTVAGTLQRPHGHHVESGDGDDGDVITTTPVPPFGLALCASPRAPALEISDRRTAESARTVQSPAFAPFAARPPPVSIPV
jgi:hypothetical protein